MPQTRTFNEPPELTMPNLWRVDWKKYGLPYCGVYVIGPERGMPVKIGIALNVPKRLATLQTSQWDKLVVHGYRWCENQVAAKKVEKATHLNLKNKQKLMAGEWFSVRVDEALQELEWAGVELNVGVHAKAPYEAHTDLVKRMMKDMLKEAMRPDNAENVDHLAQGRIDKLGKRGVHRW